LKDGKSFHAGEKRRKLMEDLGRKRQLPIELTARNIEVTLPTPASPTPEERQGRICRVGVYDHPTGGL